MTKEVPHYNVVIATPGHSLVSNYVKSLLLTIEELDKRGTTWIWSNKYASHVTDAREITIGGEDPQDAYDSRPFKGTITYDKIIWIDSDISWTPEDFIRLYESDKEIISGCYLLSNGQVVAYRDFMSNPYLYHEVQEMDEVVQVYAVGFGFVAIKQGVFERMERPWFRSAHIPMHNPKTLQPHLFSVVGEDVSFCLHAERLGYKIWLDTGVKVNHQKSITLDWSYKVEKPEVSDK